MPNPIIPATRPNATQQTSQWLAKHTDAGRLIQAALRSKLFGGPR